MPTPVDRNMLQRLVAHGAQLVEVLPRAEFEEEHLPGATSLPLRELTAETTSTRVSVELVRALLPLVVAADPTERDAVVVELKAAQRGYLAPLLEAPTPLGSTPADTFPSRRLK